MIITNYYLLIIAYHFILYYIILYYNIIFYLYKERYESFSKGFSNLFSLKKVRRPKISKKVWISLREIPIYFKKLVWLANLSAFKDELNTLQKRISMLVKRSGFQFTFQYLKLVTHYTVSFLSGRPILVGNLKGPYIALDGRGLPSILPLKIRAFLTECDLSKSSKTVGGLLSLLSIYRVFPTHVAPKYSTISGDFTGSVTSFASSKLKAAFDDLLCNIKFKKKDKFLMTLIGGESAGPNGFKAVWMAGIDAIAFIHNPKVLWLVIRWLFINDILFLSWFILLLVIGTLPYLAINVMNSVLYFYKYNTRIPALNDTLNIGKLSVVYNTAGKARVVAMTNWWIQLCFKPLHDELFKILKQLPCDGTFDQEFPLNNLIKKDIPDHLFSSYDLSAATDRLPIVLQRDILRHFCGDNLASIWCDIIRNIDWKVEDKTIRYSVGQPMGAYSSWAMLAITHHVIVRMASTDHKLIDFADYAVLGDDIVIKHNDVSASYLRYMELLGLEINLSKSVISDKFCEFAKRLKGPRIDITPIGPGLILRFIRDVFYIGNVIRECRKLNWFKNTDDVLIPMLEAYPTKGKLLTFVLWVCLGAGGAFEARPIETDHPLTDRMVSIYTGRFISPDNIEVLHMVKLSIGNAFIKVIRRDLHARDQELSRAEEYFYLNWYDTFVSNSAPIRILELILLVFNPGLWYLSESLYSARLKLDFKFEVLNRGFSSWDDIRNLISLDDDLNLSSIDWTQRKAVSNFRKRAMLLLKEIGLNWDHYESFRQENRTLRKTLRGSNSFDVLALKPRIRVAVY